MFNIIVRSKKEEANLFIPNIDISCKKYTLCPVDISDLIILLSIKIEWSETRSRTIAIWTEM